MYLRFLNQKGFYGFAGWDINIAWLGRTVPSNHRADSIDHVSYTVSSAVDAVFVIFYSLPILISNLSLFLHKDWFVMLSCVVGNLSYVFYCDGFSLQARLDSAHGFTCVVNVLFFCVLNAEKYGTISFCCLFWSFAAKWVKIQRVCMCICSYISYLMLNSLLSCFFFSVFLFQAVDTLADHCAVDLWSTDFVSDIWATW